MSSAMPTFKDISKTIGMLLLFGVIAWNLYMGASVFYAVFRGVVVYLVFNIISILSSQLFARLLTDFEIQRVRQLNEVEEMEERKRLQDKEDSR
jgi:hypothetical protein